MRHEQQTEVREDELKARAARAEKDLERTVDEMEQRVEDARDPKKLARDNAPLLTKIGAATAGGIALAVGWGAWRAATADDRRQRELNKAMKRMLLHPERVAKKESSSFLGLLKAGVVLGGLVVVVALLARSLISRMLAPRKATAESTPAPQPLPRSVPIKS